MRIQGKLAEVHGTAGGDGETHRIRDEPVITQAKKLIGCSDAVQVRLLSIHKICIWLPYFVKEKPRQGEFGQT